ncbi:alcohol dehydrogenase catalytic domain-containing protein [Arthrobacter sp. H20]|uniref:quinone oxidoreductase family protein n=1 Tax=Arthrobacter sp. H20 TaxID=1267981 RepID=UPI0004BA164E|nr:alcohol dehydrogenase catalytic domain-containing protein [Arthrobacter sp. H20]
MSKAYVFKAFGGPEGQDFIDRPVPEPGPGELLIEVRAAGVNPVDWKIRAGDLGADRELPAPMGIDVAGVVTRVGPDAGDFADGDEILGPVAPGHGSFAEHTLVRADAVVKKPRSLPFTDAAALPTAGATVYDAMHQLGLKKG